MPMPLPEKAQNRAEHLADCARGGTLDLAFKGLVDLNSKFPRQGAELSCALAQMVADLLPVSHAQDKREYLKLCHRLYVTDGDRRDWVVRGESLYRYQIRSERRANANRGGAR